MKATFFLSLLALTLAGCSSLSRRQISHYQDYGISDSLYAKIQRHQPLTETDIAEMSQRQVPTYEIITYLAFSNTDLNPTDSDVQQMWHDNINGDVITYLRENPNHTGGMLVTFSSDFYSQVGTPAKK